MVSLCNKKPAYAGFLLGYGKIQPLVIDVLVGINQAYETC